MESLIGQMLQTHLGEKWAESRFLLAVSGGVDSSVLLHLMSRLVSKDNLRVAHFDHRVRVESKNDASLVKTKCEAENLVFVLGEGSGSSLSEESLRQERRVFLESVRKKDEYIVTAHHADDQWETFLMRCIRGTGVEGLSCISPFKYPYLRPLLSLSREKILEYAKLNNISFTEDASNNSPQYFRNDLRLNVLPLLSKVTERYGGKESFLRRFTGMIEEIQELNQSLSDSTWDTFKRTCTRTSFWTRVSLKDLRRCLQPDRLLRAILQDIGKRSLEREQCHRILSWIEEKRPRFNTASGIRITQSMGQLFFQSAAQQAIRPRDFSVEKTETSFSCPALQFRMDYEGAFGPDVELRFFQEGDRFGSQKLKSVLHKRKIPRVERRFLPLLAQSGSPKVLWVYPQTLSGLKVTQADFPFSRLS